MLRLKDLATEFATLVFEDVNTLSRFSGSIRVFDEMKASGPTTQRRILELDHSTVPPTGRVCRELASGTVYVIGGEMADFWRNEVVRKKYPLITADQSPFFVGSAAQVLADTLGTGGRYGRSLPVRREVAELELSSYFQGFELYLSEPEPVQRLDVVKQGSKYFRVVLGSSVDGAGFNVAEMVELESPVRTVDYAWNSSTYDPVTDSYSQTVVQDIQVFVERAFFNYDHLNYRFEGVKVGDRMITILKSDVTQPQIGATIGEYQILGVHDVDSLSNICHVRMP